ncbi:MAG: 2-succinyl-5-enolpyruvyl-6-hydroxy-3-cyclohexene-1-carboxylic-acid synthase [Paludibacter sp.]|nr:2-succinyl-5-enolpyruvyl-6-hydroxy-3-cyclohexene-1-carboxylic-acid synthase [Paludibacter sp.]
MSGQLIKNLTYICASMGMKQAVIAPGSRNTPLILAFTRQPEIKCYPVTDERSAAFFVLGMAQYSGNPVALVCTSGTAVLNFAPAVAEAYYQHLPLIVITADRPTAWIDQADGQTIRQQHIFGNYVKASFQLPTDVITTNTWQSDRTVSQALDMALQFPRGPVHLNVPLDDPLYEALPAQHAFPRVIRTLGTVVQPDADTVDFFLKSWNNAGKRMILVGIGKHDKALGSLLETLARETETLVVAENLSNVSGEHIIATPDLFFGALSAEEKQTLLPDMLITIGHSLISKQLKQYLRRYQPKVQWQLQSEMPYADTYQSLGFVVPVKATRLLGVLADDPDFNELASGKGDNEQSYRKLIREIQQHVKSRSEAYLSNLPFSDLAVFNELMPMIPEDWVLQIANSTPVRISQLFLSRPGLQYFANRGTSGIEGSVSAAAGSATVSGKQTLLITGDLSFLYDSNGLWNCNFPDNLKILLLNNGGANIFRIIGDQEITKDAQEFFDASHQVDIKSLVSAYGIKYSRCDQVVELKSMLTRFMQEKGASVLEVVTEMDINMQTYKELFKYIR